MSLSTIELPTTEASTRDTPVDARASQDAAQFLLSGQQAALGAVGAVLGEIAQGGPRRWPPPFGRAIRSSMPRRAVRA